MISARAEGTVPVQRLRTEQRIVDFDAELLKAPLLLRCGAILIDYILLICIPVVCLLLGRSFSYDGSKLLTSEFSNAGWLIMILFALTNLVIFPLVVGKSLGKMLTGLRVVKTDGHPASLVSLLIRHLIGYPLTFLTLGLGFLIAIFNQEGRALHDLLAGTVVIYGRRKIKS